jgi:Holliday junction resolvase
LPPDYFTTSEGLAITVFYFPAAPMQGDLDNIVKLILDALNQHIYEDDSQIERIVVQKFEPARIFAFSAPTTMLQEGMRREKPVVYIRLSNDPLEDLS